MKRTSRFLTVCCMLFVLRAQAQQPMYDARWKRVDSLYRTQDLPKSALAEVQQIYRLAKQQKRQAQVVKALVYMVMLQSQLREQNLSLSIGEVEKEAAQSPEPARSLLKSLQARLYWNYLAQNRYRLYGRTNTVHFNKTDIGTWTADDLNRATGRLYLESIAAAPVLKNIPVGQYEPVVTKGNLRYLRPTLYDLLAHEALDYFTNDERDITRPAYRFELEDTAAFLPAISFVHHRFTPTDSLSLYSKALNVYQDLVAFHLHDAKPDALVDVDLERLNFVHNYSTAPGKDQRYIMAVRRLYAQYAHQPTAQEAGYHLAQWYVDKAASYTPLGDTTYRYYKDSARRLLLPLVADSAQKNSSWTRNFNLLRSITAPAFSISTETVNVPEIPFRAAVSFTNVRQLYFHLRPIPYGASFGNERDSLIAELGRPALHTWTQQLPLDSDLQEHTTEIRIDALPIGHYALVATNGAEGDGQVLAAQEIFVSDISYFHNNETYFFVNRETGRPLAGAAVQFWRQSWNNELKLTPDRIFKTDSTGSVKISDLVQRNENWLFDVRYGNDRLFLNSSQYIYTTEKQAPSDRINVAFFTDRSIYRPGQTAQAKLIFFRTNSQQTSNDVLPHHKTTVYLTDPHGRNIDSAKVETNDFGSAAVSFHLPLSGMTGNYRITAHGPNYSYSQNISVEEYKRPKFSVAFEPVVRNYLVRDTITVEGKALAYAGNNIDGARVSYHVQRRPQIRYSFFGRFMPQVEPEEIAHGETTTDAQGRFTISFPALPDEKLDRSLDPEFNFQVSADVTDINGETRSASRSVAVGYTSLRMNVEIPERIGTGMLDTLSVRTENRNGQSVSAPITLSLTKLLPEQRLIRERYWDRPDQFVMSKEEYVHYFPHDEYDNELDPASWPKSGTVFTATDSTRTSGKLHIPASTLQPGFYLLELAIPDRSGIAVKDSRMIEIFDPSSNALARPEYLWFQGEQQTLEPGRSGQVTIGSAADVYLFNWSQRNQQWTSHTMELNHEKRTFNITPRETDRGGLFEKYFFVRDNRLYQADAHVTVPWTNKQLDISYETFRDHLLPGQPETWTVRIRGPKKEQAAAELLASMYDASLDQFVQHNWTNDLWPDRSGTGLNWQSDNFNINVALAVHQLQPRDVSARYDQLIFSEANNFSSNIRYGNVAQAARRFPSMQANGVPKVEMDKFIPPTVVADHIDEQVAEEAAPAIQPRTNFNETAFFFPQLHTDRDGRTSFSFTIPEALTQWKLQLFAHTKDMATALSQKTVVTQKKLMVQPNIPRFVRQGDQMEIVTKIVNLSDTELTGQAQLELIDAVTQQPVDGWFMNTFPNQYFTVAAGQSEAVKFPIQVPAQFTKELKWRITARAGNYSDAEEDALPVLSNQVLITETLPLPMRGAGTKHFRFEKLLRSAASETLQQHALTVEYTANPVWYAVQSLPYLMSYPYECAEQSWNRYYADALSAKIVRSAPGISKVLEQWKDRDTAALLSNLEKDPELKSILLEETPWVLDAASESERKKNLALLLDMARLQNEGTSALKKLQDLQMPNGSFPWFAGGSEDRYITQYIVTGIGHLQRLNAIPSADQGALNAIIKKALDYLDGKLVQDYALDAKSKTPAKRIDPLRAGYLYMRSFFTQPLSADAQKAAMHYRELANRSWTGQSKYVQGMIALALQRSGKQGTAQAIIRSLNETSINSETLGMYWKDNAFGRSWYWQDAPIETQSLLIEAFNEIAPNAGKIDDMRTWLLLNKQTSNWTTTRATADACYALLLRGSDWLESTAGVRISLGNITVGSDSQPAEAGTGYFKKTFDAKDVQPQMGEVTVTVTDDRKSGTDKTPASWGAVYWQYFQQIDQVTAAATPLRIERKIFLETNGDRGPELHPLTEGTALKVGNKIRVRLELRVDRDISYVHLKDMRAAGTEPLNVLSGYKWQGSLGYYESTRDASTNFFFDRLPKGTYVFEYPLFVTHAGDFTSGIAQIQCLYAPEFSAHSEGGRLTAEEQ